MFDVLKNATKIPANIHVQQEMGDKMKTEVESLEKQKKICEHLLFQTHLDDKQKVTMEKKIKKTKRQHL